MAIGPRIWTPRGIQWCSDITYGVRDLIRVTHLGQRPGAAHKGRTYDRNRPGPFSLPNPCETGAVHIWIPACPTDQVRGLKAHGKALW